MHVIHGILKEYLEAKVEVQAAASNPAAACSHDHAMVRILAKNAERVTRMKPLAIPSIGATDCKFWRYKGAGWALILSYR
jgi:succinyl-diaminopimelate desuccinylase